MLKDYFHNFVTDESGQGITEYGAILAFVAILVAIAFTAVNTGLRSAVSQSFSSVISSLGSLNQGTS